MGVKNIFKTVFVLMMSVPIMGCSENAKINSDEITVNNKQDQETEKDTIVNLTTLPVPVKITCVGNSITEGYGNSSQDKAWPAQLNNLLGGNYYVLNCGKSGHTMCKNTDYPYWGTDQYNKALASNPDILIMALGTNDADPWRWNNVSNDFVNDYSDMLLQFQKEGKSPVIYVCLPPPLYGDLKKAQNDVVENELIPLISDIIAPAFKANIIDFHYPLLESSDAFPDDVHPNDTGAKLMAEIAYDLIYKMQNINVDIKVTDGKVENDAVVFVKKGSSVTFIPEIESSQCTWIGKDGIISNEKDLQLDNIQCGGIYTFKYCNASKNGVRKFVVSVDGEKGKNIAAKVIYNGSTINSNHITVNPGSDITLCPEVDEDANGYWSWKGPKSFFAGTKDITLQSIPKSMAGKYTVTYTDNEGNMTDLDYTIDVEGELICPNIVPYISYDGGWQQTDKMAVKMGDSVKFGPQPTNGNWSWIGPAGFSSENREATVSNFNSDKVGQYIGVFTNAAGCREELVITLTLKQ